MIDIVLPAIARSGDSSVKKIAYVDRQETFSQAYKHKLPYQYLQELAFCYVSTSGNSYSEIVNVNSALIALCDFSIAFNIRSVDDLDHSRVVHRYFEFLKQKYTSSWKSRFRGFRLCFKDRFSQVAWPSIRKDNNPTVGHTPYAYTEMLKSLRQEIDRIRNKVRIWDAAIKKDKIITFDDLEPSWRSDYIPFSFSKEDLVATFNHFMPGWPALYRFYDGKHYHVYRTPKGVLLGVSDNETEASEIAKAYDGIVVKNSGYSFKAQVNPAEYLLSALHKNGQGSLGKYLYDLIGGMPELIEEYYPTVYDLTCVIMYWALLTGWNLETMRSVSVHDLGLIFPKENVMKLISSEHIAIRGYKRRGQRTDEAKEYVHVSDKSDEYGLYRVLSDMFTLSKPFRRYLKGDEQNCILAGISLTSGQGDSFITVFGPSSKCLRSPLNVKQPQCLRFFTKHEIFEDGARTERVISTDTMKIRTAYESMLEFLGVPIDVIRLFMRHETMDTTMTSYGSDQVSLSIRREQLRINLDQLSEKVFQGTLVRYEQAKKRSRNESSSNVVQLFMHSNNPVFVCKNRTAPTWKGHEKYVTDGNCIHLEECLFCKQCCVTEESLPYLLRWKRDINEWLSEAPSDKSRHLLAFLQAIEEVLELCYEYGGPWLKSLNDAEIKEMDPHFMAPPFWIGG